MWKSNWKNAFKRSINFAILANDFWNRFAWVAKNETKNEQKEEEEEDNKRPTTNKTIMIIISTSQFVSPLFYCTHRLQCTIIQSTMCRKFALNILDHKQHLFHIFCVNLRFFASYSGWWPLSQKFIACTVWHDLVVGNYTVNKSKIGYHIQIVLCIESVSADFLLLLILMDLFFFHFWANRRWVFWTVAQCQDQNQNHTHTNKQSLCQQVADSSHRAQ